MIRSYKTNEHSVRTGDWGAASDVFYGSESEKYLGFGELVQVTRWELTPGASGAGAGLQRNMETVDIILSGSAGFQDSMGMVAQYPAGTMQVVSAGRGIYRTMFEPAGAPATVLQIGFLPNTLNTRPVTTKGLFDLAAHRNALVELVSPGNPGSLTVRQHAAVLLGTFDGDQHVSYGVSGPGVGIFLCVVDGGVTMGTEHLRRGDAAGIIREDQVLFHTMGETTIMLIEVALSPEENEQ